MRKLKLQKSRKHYYSSDEEDGNAIAPKAPKATAFSTAKKQTGRPHIQPKVQQTQPSESFEGLMFV